MVCRVISSRTNIMKPDNNPDKTKGIPDMDLMDLTPKSDEIVVTLKHPATDEPLKNPDNSDMTITI